MQNRRRFLRNSLVALTGTSLAARTSSAVPLSPGEQGSEREFVFRTLGKTGVRLPVVSMGTGNTNSVALVSRALDEGVKLLATSGAYQNGNNEKMVARAIKGRPRDSFMIMTSARNLGYTDYQGGRYLPGATPAYLMEKGNGCLERLELEYVDIFVLPFAARRESVYYEPFLRAMESFKKQGKTRYIGIATHSFEPEAIRAAADVGIYDVVMTAYNFRKQNLEEMHAAMEYATGKGMGVIAMKTMAGAYWDREKAHPINTRAALKWVLQNGHVHTTVPDCSHFEHLVDDLDIMADLSLSQEEWKDLEPPAGDASSGLYCQQCRTCLDQCPFPVDIPSLMRSYMYAYGYRNLEHARKTLEMAAFTGDPCSSCMECKVQCASGFDIRGRITDIVRLRDIPEDMIRFA